jgi:hypothetical protein
VHPDRMAANLGAAAGAADTGHASDLVDRVLANR